MKILLARINEFNCDLHGHPRDVFMPFDLSMLSSVLGENHEVEIADGDVLNWGVEEWKTKMLQNFELIVVKYDMGIAKELTELLRFVKSEQSVKILLLGFEDTDWHIRLLKDSLVDAFVWGDPELTVNNYVKTGELGKGMVWIKNGLVRKTGPVIIKDLDNLPFYNHKQFLSDNYFVYSKCVGVKNRFRWGFMLTSRGCPFGCEFCTSNIRNSFGKCYRSMSVERVLRELEYMVKGLEINAISFEDDLFTLDKQRVTELCEGIIQRRLSFSWVVSTRADCLDMSLIKIMKKAGCKGMAIGVESGSERVLKLMKKGEGVSKIREMLGVLRQEGVSVTANVIVGYPSETKEDFLETLQLIKESKPLFVHAHYLTLYPDTGLSKQMQNQNKDRKYPLSHRKYGKVNLSQMDTSVLKESIRELYLKYYLSFDYLKTYLKYRWMYWLYNPRFELRFLMATGRYLRKK